MDIQIGPARGEDVNDVLRLLEASHLPVDGLREHAAAVVVARQGGRVVGSAALEIYSDGGLLRSVAVSPGLQRAGIGRQLIERAIQTARTADIPAIYLLTTTAAGYFLRFGFERIDRNEVPAGVRQSVEFASACPASATVMRKMLG
jgi:amino-acid N-acetyltransferase